MGFKQKAESFKYVGVRYGMLSYKTDADDSHPNLVKRAAKDDNGNVTGNNYYVEFPAFEGYITNLNVKDIEFNNKMLTFLEVTLEDGDDRIVLQLKWNHPMTKYTLAKLPNINYHLPVEFAAGKDKRDYNTLYVKQTGQLIPLYYTREDPKDKPSWEPLKNKKGDIVSWDSSAEDDFYRNLVVKMNTEQVGSAKNFVESRNEIIKSEPKIEPVSAPVETFTEDDLEDGMPF